MGVSKEIENSFFRDRVWQEGIFVNRKKKHNTSKLRIK